MSPWPLATVIAAAALALPSSAAARATFETIVQDDAQFLHRPSESVAASASDLRSLGVDRVRITAGWSVIAPKADAEERPDFDARDPNAYPRGAWNNLDRAVSLASAAGLEVMIDIAFWAPRWATSGDPEPGRGRARWNVNARDYGAFAEAVVTRYSGGFVPQSTRTEEPPPPPSNDSNFLEDLFGKRAPQPAPPAREPATPADPLPPVRWWTIWNEPNYDGFLLPQWVRTDDGWRPRSPHLYRELVEAAYPVIKRLQPDSMVLVGGLAPNGEAQPKSAEDPMPALRFLRELACVNAGFIPLTGGECADYRPLPGDGLAHHPYSLYRAPAWRALKRPDNLPVGALDRLTATLTRLVSMGRISPGLLNLYLTEYGYESNPPDPERPFNPEQQARLLSWAEAIAWRNPFVRSWPQFLLRDMGVVDASTGRPVFADWQTGLRYVDGTPKPALAAFRLPLHAECSGTWESGRKLKPAKGRGRNAKRRRPARTGAVPQVVIWGRVRPDLDGQPLLLAADAGGWGLVATATRTRGLVTTLPLRLDADGVFQRYTPWRPGMRLKLVTRTLTATTAEGIEVEPAKCPDTPAYLRKGV